MFGLFSDIFTYRENALRRADPRIKFAGALFLIMAIIMSTRVIIPLATCLLSISCLYLMRMPLRIMLKRLSVPFSIALVLVVLQTFMTGTTPFFTFHEGRIILIATREGLAAGLLMSARVLGAVSVILVLSSSTPAFQIFHALRWLRVSPDWIEIAMLMYRYTFTLLDLTDDMASAQRVRLGYHGIRRAVTSTGTLAGAVLLRSIDQSVRTQDAMTLRGYSGHMPFGKMPNAPLAEKWLLTLYLITIAGLYTILEGRLL